MIDIDFPQVKKDAKIVIGMSSGVDSSTVAALLQEAGYTNLLGITLVLYDSNESKGLLCHDSRIREDVIRVSSDLGIKHEFLDLKNVFMNKVIDPFINSYLNGETPNPCVNCNRDIKFGALIDYMEQINADILVTGHFIKLLINKNNSGEIYRGSNQIRDQSYFLSMVRKSSLNKIRFPLSNMSKEDVRQHAKRLNLHLFDKPASNDICFAGGLNYNNLFKSHGDSIKKGQIIDLNGNVLGEHDGIIHYTVGQRKGIKIGGSQEPFFVVFIDVEKIQIVVGHKKDFIKRDLIISDLNWLDDDPINESQEVLIKVRSSQNLIEANLFPLPENKAQVVLKEEIMGISRGQICGIYQYNNKLLGGGKII